MLTNIGSVDTVNSADVTCELDKTSHTEGLQLYHTGKQKS